MKTNKRQALSWLGSCFRGEIPVDIDWDVTVALANASMTTTNLAARVLQAPCRDKLPEDVKVFLTDVASRNARRNARLLEQLEDVLCVLNGVGIVPVLLKGAAIIVNNDIASLAERMISDIDILVKVEEQARALGCLEGVGYRVFDRSGAADGPVTLARVSDVGMIDIHTRMRGPTALTASGRLYADCKPASLHSAMCLVPSPTFQILHFVLHDQFHNRDFWKGHMDIRHVCDVAKIITQCPAIDWDFLRSVFSNRTAADALASQLIQVTRLLGVSVPTQFSGRPMARLQYRRILTQMRYPYLRKPFICLTILLGWNHRNRDDVNYDVSAYRRLSGKMRGIWRLFNADTLGKA